MARNGVLVGSSDRPEKWTWELLVHRLDSEPEDLNDPRGECTETGCVRALTFAGRRRQTGSRWGGGTGKTLGRDSQALGVVGPISHPKG